ncbi:hypothetical protein QUB60_10370 [Microcoleus sp. A2-C5]|uniref:hypothetical protein n=1 Tax=unclassified Microcoleus TaxID=2642155 RepID=UPI002FD25A39
MLKIDPPNAHAIEIGCCWEMASLSGISEARDYSTRTAGFPHHTASVGGGMNAGEACDCTAY